MLVSVSHPMSTSPVPVIEYVAPASAVTYTELSPVTEYVAPAPASTLAARSPAIEHVAPASAVTYTALSSVIEYVASAPVVFYAVIEHSALQRSGHEHEHTWKRRKKDPMMRCTFFFSPVRLVLFFFFFKITRPSNNFEFSKFPVTNPEHDFLPGNFLFVRLQIKIVSRIISVIILAPMVCTYLKM